MKDGTFQCGTCNLYEIGLSDKEILALSNEHFNGNHIDIFELRKKSKKS